MQPVCKAPHRVRALRRARSCKEDVYHVSRRRGAQLAPRPKFAKPARGNASFLLLLIISDEIVPRRGDLWLFLDRGGCSAGGD